MEDHETTFQHRMWLKDEREGCIACVVLSPNLSPNTPQRDNQVQIQLIHTGQEKYVDASELEPMNPELFDRSEDLAQLSHLNESAVYSNLRDRFHSDMIYTYSGLFLVAMNPWKRLPIYTDDIMNSYKATSRHHQPPHLFAVCDEAYRNLRSYNQNQTILITGESGSGKTVNTSKVIQYFANLVSTFALPSSTPTTATPPLQMQITGANPILESFGNAKTLRNNNSSRFGKFIELRFDGLGRIHGAHIQHYLLEKSRVVHHAKDERTFHIFYQLLAGASEQLRDELQLEQASDYQWLAETGMHLAGVDDRLEFDETVNSMTTLSFTASEQLSIWKILASILQMGNLTFKTRRGKDDAILSDLDAPRKLCAILGISKEAFERALLKPTIHAGEFDVVATVDVAKANAGVQAMAKGIYERLFTWILDKINRTLMVGVGGVEASRNDIGNFIGVLDIAGFEIFKTNGFEQLCINLTNEKLQQFFNHRMFILEQEIYQSEGIQWHFVDFGLDLQPTIDLIEQPLGVLSVLEEQCLFPKSTTATLMQQLEAKNHTHPAFSTVEYDTQSWLEKNRDPFDQNLVKMLSGSSNLLLAELFSVGSSGSSGPSGPSGASGFGNEKISTSAASARQKGAQFTTVSQRYRIQLQQLMSDLQQTTPHFIRCILPNESKTPGVLDASLVMRQLKCNGVLEGIRVCRLGFPSRILFSEFKQRFQILNPPTTATAIPRQQQKIQLQEAPQLECQRILNVVEEQKRTKDAEEVVSAKDYRFGRSKIFFKSGVMAKLEREREKKLAQLMLQFQRFVRGMLSRRKYHNRVTLLEKVELLQRNARVFVKQLEDPWLRLLQILRPLLEHSQRSQLHSKEQEKENILLHSQLTACKEQLKMAEELDLTVRKELDMTVEELKESRHRHHLEHQQFQLNEENLRSAHAQLLLQQQELSAASESLASTQHELAASNENSLHLQILLDALQSKAERTERELTHANSTLYQAQTQLHSLQRHYQQQLTVHDATKTELEQTRQVHSDATTQLDVTLEKLGAKEIEVVTLSQQHAILRQESARALESQKQENHEILQLEEEKRRGVEEEAAETTQELLAVVEEWDAFKKDEELQRDALLDEIDALKSQHGQQLQHLDTSASSERHQHSLALQDLLSQHQALTAHSKELQSLHDTLHSDNLGHEHEKSLLAVKLDESERSHTILNDQLARVTSDHTSELERRVLLEQTFLALQLQTSALQLHHQQQLDASRAELEQTTKDLSATHHQQHQHLTEEHEILRLTHTQTLHDLEVSDAEFDAHKRLLILSQEEKTMAEVEHASSLQTIMQESQHALDLAHSQHQSHQKNHDERHQNLQTDRQRLLDEHATLITHHHQLSIDHAALIHDRNEQQNAAVTWRSQYEAMVEELKATIYAHQNLSAENSNKMVEEHAKKVKSLEGSIYDLSESNASISRQHQSMQTLLLETQAALLAETKTHSETRLDLQKLQADFDALSANTHSLNHAHEVLRQASTESSSSLATLHESLGNLQDEVKGHQTSRELMEAQLLSSNETLNVLSAELESAKTHHETLNRHHQSCLLSLQQQREQHTSHLQHHADLELRANESETALAHEQEEQVKMSERLLLLQSTVNRLESESARKDRFVHQLTATLQLRAEAHHQLLKNKNEHERLHLDACRTQLHLQHQLELAQRLLTLKLRSTTTPASHEHPTTSEKHGVAILEADEAIVSVTNDDTAD